MNGVYPPSEPWLYRVIDENLMGASLSYFPRSTRTSAQDPRFEYTSEYIGINVSTSFTDAHIVQVKEYGTPDLLNLELTDGTHWIKGRISKRFQVKYRGLNHGNPLEAHQLESRLVNLKQFQIRLYWHRKHVEKLALHIYELDGLGTIPPLAQSPTYVGDVCQIQKRLQGLDHLFDRGSESSRSLSPVQHPSVDLSQPSSNMMTQLPRRETQDAPSPPSSQPAKLAGHRRHDLLQLLVAPPPQPPPPPPPQVPTLVHQHPTGRPTYDPLYDEEEDEEGCSDPPLASHPPGHDPPNSGRNGPMEERRVTPPDLTTTMESMYDGAGLEHDRIAQPDAAVSMSSWDNNAHTEKADLSYTNQADSKFGPPLTRHVALVPKDQDELLHQNSAWVRESQDLEQDRMGVPDSVVLALEASLKQKEQNKTSKQKTPEDPNDYTANHSSKRELLIPPRADTPRADNHVLFRTSPGLPSPTIQGPLFSKDRSDTRSSSQAFTWSASPSPKRFDDLPPDSPFPSQVTDTRSQSGGSVVDCLPVQPQGSPRSPLLPAVSPSQLLGSDSDSDNDRDFSASPPRHRGGWTSADKFASDFIPGSSPGGRHGYDGAVTSTLKRSFSALNRVPDSSMQSEMEMAVPKSLPKHRADAMPTTWAEDSPHSSAEVMVQRTPTSSAKRRATEKLDDDYIPRKKLDTRKFLAQRHTFSDRGLEEEDPRNLREQLEDAAAIDDGNDDYIADHVSSNAPPFRTSPSIQKVTQSSIKARGSALEENPQKSREDGLGNSLLPETHGPMGWASINDVIASSTPPIRTNGTHTISSSQLKNPLISRGFGGSARKRFLTKATPAPSDVEQGPNKSRHLEGSLARQIVEPPATVVDLTTSPPSVSLRSTPSASPRGLPAPEGDGAHATQISVVSPHQSPSPVPAMGDLSPVQESIWIQPFPVREVIRTSSCPSQHTTPAQASPEPVPILNEDTFTPLRSPPPESIPLRATATPPLVQTHSSRGQASVAEHASIAEHASVAERASPMPASNQVEPVIQVASTPTRSPRKPIPNVQYVSPVPASFPTEAPSNAGSSPQGSRAVKQSQPEPTKPEIQEVETLDLSTMDRKDIHSVFCKAYPTSAKTLQYPDFMRIAHIIHTDLLPEYAPELFDSIVLVHKDFKKYYETCVRNSKTSDDFPTWLRRVRLQPVSPEKPVIITAAKDRDHGDDEARKQKNAHPVLTTEVVEHMAVLKAKKRKSSVGLRASVGGNDPNGSLKKQPTKAVSSLLAPRRSFGVKRSVENLGTPKSTPEKRTKLTSTRDTAPVRTTGTAVEKTQVLITKSEMNRALLSNVKRYGTMGGNEPETKRLAPEAATKPVPVAAKEPVPESAKEPVPKAGKTPVLEAPTRSSMARALDLTRPVEPATDREPSAPSIGNIRADSMMGQVMAYMRQDKVRRQMKKGTCLDDDGPIDVLDWNI